MSIEYRISGPKGQKGNYRHVTNKETKELVGRIFRWERDVVHQERRYDKHGNLSGASFEKRVEVSWIGQYPDGRWVGPVNSWSRKLRAHMKDWAKPLAWDDPGRLEPISTECLVAGQMFHLWWFCMQGSTPVEDVWWTRWKSQRENDEPTLRVTTPEETRAYRAAAGCDAARRLMQMPEPTPIEDVLTAIHAVRNREGLKGFSPTDVNNAMLMAWFLAEPCESPKIDADEAPAETSTSEDPREPV